MIFTLEIYLATLKEGPWFGFTDNNNQTYENLFIRDGSEKPTKQECIDGVKAMQADYDARQYQRDRMVSYPSVQEQLDLIYWDKINDTEKWKETIDKVKLENPKPSE